jgi:hypothetical protein
MSPALRYRITTVSRPSRPAHARYRISNIAEPRKVPLKGAFGPGFQFQTDEELRLQIHVLSQTEARVWGQGDQSPANSGFFFPRRTLLVKSLEFS